MKTKSIKMIITMSFIGLGLMGCSNKADKLLLKNTTGGTTNKVVQGADACEHKLYRGGETQETFRDDIYDFFTAFADTRFEDFKYTNLTGECDGSVKIFADINEDGTQGALEISFEEQSILISSNTITRYSYNENKNTLEVTFALGGESQVTLRGQLSTFEKANDPQKLIETLEGAAYFSNRTNYVDQNNRPLSGILGNFKVNIDEFDK